MRNFINTSWNNADSFDYTGRQQSHSHFLNNGQANTKAYGDDVKKENKRPIASRIIPSQAALNRCDEQEKELRETYENGEIDLEEYLELQGVLDRKRDKAYKSLCKALQIEDGSCNESVEKNDSGSCFSKELGLFGTISKGISRQSIKFDLIYMLTASFVACILLLKLSN